MFERPSSKKREDYLSHAEIRQAAISRRRFLGGMVMGMAALTPASVFLAIDSVEAKEFWHNAVAEVHDVYHTPEQPTDKPRRGAFLLPGFDVFSLKEAAHSQLPALSPDHQYVGHITYGNDGLDIDQVVKIVRDKADEQDLEFVTFLGQSMGGPISIQVAVGLHESGFFEKRVTVDRFCFYSSPLDFSHLQPEAQQTVRGIAGNPMVVGPTLRFGFESVARMQRGENLDEAVADARKMLTSDSCSNLLLRSMAQNMIDFKLEDYKNRLPLGVQWGLMCTSVPRQDNYVNVLAVPPMFNSLYGNKMILTSPHVNHADVTATPWEFARMTSTIMNAFNEHDRLLGLDYPRNAGGI